MSSLFHLNCFVFFLEKEDPSHPNGDQVEDLVHFGADGVEGGGDHGLLFLFGVGGVGGGVGVGGVAPPAQRATQVGGAQAFGQRPDRLANVLHVVDGHTQLTSFHSSPSSLR